MIRKQVTKSLTDLLKKYPHHNNVIEAWVRGVITLLADSDTKSLEKVIDVSICSLFKLYGIKIIITT